MPLIEPHIHATSRTAGDLCRMAAAGIVACVEPSSWSGVYRRSPASFEDHWEQIVTCGPRRSQPYGMSHFAMVGLNPKEAGSPIARDVLRAMEPFLDRFAVIGIGEIGLEHMAPEEEDSFRRQLRMAEERRLPVIAQPPAHNREKAVERMLEIIDEEEVSHERIMIDHNSEETLGLVLDTSGCWAGLTVSPLGLSVSRAVEMTARRGHSRVIVNGSADWGCPDALAVPRTAALMGQRGFSAEAIRSVTFTNALSFLSSSGRFAVGED